MTKIVYMVDPRKITERIFGGPQFGKFETITNDHVKCCKNGDVFDIRGLNEAWMESRNLAPLNYEENK